MHPLYLKLCLAIVLACLTLIPASGSQPAVQPPESPMAWFHEVRLRKLHLVRPDLIPYPVYFEVYC